ncbi:MAG: asparagine synthase (glutamine-hydrolyzing) [Chloroflexi bacterium CFX7]|nr:asparagine synthase (glutamine-hydrolyzing) [Chloroflexi bacterium CFX7]RIL02696.1 MAG: asparagine synthase (glutamine-hydrolyzing) [bacterium]
MCGIAGILRAGGEPVPPGYIAAMVDTLRHRGPDGDGSFFAPGIALGHTRLAIIDLTPASGQPFVDEAAGLALVFNGEIYNYLELRSELKALGHDFRSSGDVEVLLRAYEQWGHDCLARLNGMFAFAIWNSRKQELFLARDRFGEKPLFLARSPKGLVFASEMKAILAVRPELRRPNRKPIFRYLARGDLDLDEATFFDGIEHLPAAHYMIVDAAGRPVCRRYWSPTSAPVPASRKQATEGFRELFFDAIRVRLRSDVPVGSSLSGGIDSSSIVATINAQKASHFVHQRTFSARFRSPAHDEGRYINALTRQLDAEPHEVWVEPDHFVEEFGDLQWHQEEPIASTSPFAQWLVMRLARESGTTVLLDGQSADELLAGYDQAQGMFWAHWARRGRLDLVAREVLSFVRRYRAIRQPALFAAYYSLPETLRDRLAEFYYRSNGVVSHDLHREFAPAHADATHPFPDRLRNELVRWQTATQLPEFLRYADRNSMAFGREVRLPFLDHRLIEYCFGLPPDMLLRRAVTKVVLRDAMRGIVPDEILDRRDKLAYSPPQRQWVHGPLRPWIEDLLAAAERRTTIFKPLAVRGLRERLQKRPADVLTWRVISTEAWFQRLIDRPGCANSGQAEISPLSW